jgi:hypothetical protein
VDDDLDHRSISGLLNDPRTVAFNRAVLERDALPKSPEGLLRELATDGRNVSLEYLVGRMRETVRQLTVIREDEESLGIGVEPANVEQPFGPILHVVTDTRPATIVSHRRDDSARLVERDHGDTR